MPKCLLLEGRTPVIKSLAKAFIHKHTDDSLDNLFPPEPKVDRGGRDDDDMFGGDMGDDMFDEEFDEGGYDDEFDEFGGGSRRGGTTFESLDNYLDTM